MNEYGECTRCGRYLGELPNKCFCWLTDETPTVNG